MSFGVGTVMSDHGGIFAVIGVASSGSVLCFVHLLLEGYQMMDAFAELFLEFFLCPRLNYLTVFSVPFIRTNLPSPEINLDRSLKMQSSNSTVFPPDPANSRRALSAWGLNCEYDEC
ncbi:hypothetical protein V6N11_047408 [Hibiscus sabdariffa]|uniref:Uncharacterized protein n=1 Tax=Hibiscus sabdariffa TaxID=183260 RepID=A0ABR2A493_9ROSI